MKAKASSKKQAAATDGNIKNVAASYNAVKKFKGQQYTGMKIGRSHKWNYDKGVWRETKVTPDRWELSYNVTKRRAGHAPEGSGVPVGTAYHWFILSHQYVEKLNADDYTTSMTGVKFKIAHLRAATGKWNISEKTQRTHLIKLLEDFVAELKAEPAKTLPVLFSFNFNGKNYNGNGVPVISSCKNGVCSQLSITLNKKQLGVIKQTKNGWKLSSVKQKMATAIGKQIESWYA